MTDNDTLAFEERKRRWQEEQANKDWEADVPKLSYCGCCGAQFTAQINKETKGEHYTDCMWYKGDKPHDFNPH